MLYKAIYNISQILVVIMFSEDNKKWRMLNLPHVQTKLSSAFFWFINMTLVVELLGKIEAFHLCLILKTC